MGKYFVSKLPLVMKRKGIKNVTELAIRTGILQEKLIPIMNGKVLELDYLNALADFFECKINNLVELEENYRSYTDRLDPDPRYNGVVYFLKADNGLTKIGWSGNLKSRKDSLERAEGIKTTLTHYISTHDCLVLEKTLHNIFSAKRVKGEWFDLTDEDIALVKEDKQ